MNQLGKKKKIKFKKNFNNTLVKNRIGSVKKAEVDLKFISKVGLTEGLKDLITWREGKLKRVKK